MLLAPFSKEEFKKAVFQMHPDKAPGPDDLNPAFYRRFWECVEMIFIRRALNGLMKVHSRTLLVTLILCGAKM